MESSMKKIAMSLLLTAVATSPVLAKTSQRMDGYAARSSFAQAPGRQGADTNAYSFGGMDPDLNIRAAEQRNPRSWDH
jgi:hypothetical protein